MSATTATSLGETFAKLVDMQTARFEALETTVARLTAEVEQLKKSAGEPDAVRIFDSCIDNYSEPGVAHLTKSFLIEHVKLYGVQAPIELVPAIWFSPVAPQNFSVKIAGGITRVRADGKWVIADLRSVSAVMRSRAYDVVNDCLSCMCNAGTHGQLGPYSHMLTHLVENMHDGNIIEYECERLQKMITERGTR